MKQKTVRPEVIAKTYLLAELARIFRGEATRQALRKGIATLDPKPLWRLLEAMSFTYRLNGVFWYLGDTSFTWKKLRIDCRDIRLTGMNPRVDKVTHSKAIGQDPLRFRDYLLVYFKKHPKKDPQGLGQFRPTRRVVKDPTILVFKRGEHFYLIDGANRLMAQILKGRHSVTAYVGEQKRTGKRRVGDSTFLLLRILYQRGDTSTRRAALILTRELMRLSTDGKESVRTYWVDHARDPVFKKVGRGLLE